MQLAGVLLIPLAFAIFVGVAGNVFIGGENEGVALYGAMLVVAAAGWLIARGRHLAGSAAAVLALPLYFGVYYAIQSPLYDQAREVGSSSAFSSDVADELQNLIFLTHGWVIILTVVVAVWIGNAINQAAITRR